MTPADTEHGGSIGDRAWVVMSRRWNCTVVTVSGEVDMQSAAPLERTLESAASSSRVRSSCLVVDLTELVFLDSSGLGVLISARNYALVRGVSMVLVNPPPLMRRLLTQTRLHRSFAIYDTLDDALAALPAR